MVTFFEYVNIICLVSEAATRGALYKKVFLEVSQNLWNLVQVFSCEICEIYRNTFFTERVCTTAFVVSKTSYTFVVSEGKTNLSKERLNKGRIFLWFEFSVTLLSALISLG